MASLVRHRSSSRTWLSSASSWTGYWRCRSRTVSSPIRPRPRAHCWKQRTAGRMVAPSASRWSSSARVNSFSALAVLAQAIGDRGYLRWQVGQATRRPTGTDPVHHDGWAGEAHLAATPRMVSRIPGSAPGQQPPEPSPAPRDDMAEPGLSCHPVHIAPSAALAR